MKTKSTSKSAFFNLRVLIASVFCVIGVFIALGGARVYSAQSKAQQTTAAGGPKVVRMIGPVVMNDLRSLPYIPATGREEGPRLTRYPFPLSGRPGKSDTSAFTHSQSLMEKILTPIPNMPPPLLTFPGTDRVGSGCNCRPPDTNGDVGPNHYVQTVNIGFRVFDKSGNPLTPFTTYNSFFAPWAPAIPVAITKMAVTPSFSLTRLLIAGAAQRVGKSAVLPSNVCASRRFLPSSAEKAIHPVKSVPLTLQRFTHASRFFIEHSYCPLVQRLCVLV